MPIRRNQEQARRVQKQSRGLVAAMREALWVLCWGTQSGDRALEPSMSGKTTVVALWSMLLFVAAVYFLGPQSLGLGFVLSQALDPASRISDGPGLSDQAAQGGWPSDSGEPQSGAPEQLIATALEKDTVGEPAPPVRSWRDPTDAEICEILNCAAGARFKHALPSPKDLVQNVPAIEDPQGSGLRHFYQALSSLERNRQGMVHVLHYGDSLVVPDWVTKTTRQLLQDRFGDGGLGFSLPAKPWPWYLRAGLNIGSPSVYLYRLVGPWPNDRMVGLGGVAAVAQKGTVLRYEFKTPPAQTQNLEIQYLAAPNSGSFWVYADRQKLIEIDGAAESMQAAFQTLEIPAQTKRVSIRVVQGAVRFFGLVFEQQQPGVVYDSLGLNAALAAHWLLPEPRHFAEQLANRHPDLIILNFGLNESRQPHLSMKWHEEKLRLVIQRMRNAAPAASCLVVSPMDRPVMGKSGWDSVPRIEPLLLVQRKVALTEGCAFYNTYKAMGGTDSFERWMRARPKLGGADLLHPTERGAQLLGQMLFTALMNGYSRSLHPTGSPPQNEASAPMQDGLEALVKSPPENQAAKKKE